MEIESALRRDVVLANRIIERFGLSNAFGHVSARIPGTNSFVFPTRRSPGLAEEANLLILDTDGNVLSGQGTPNSEFWIHARAYDARPDVGGVVHAHPPACICLTQIGEPIALFTTKASHSSTAFLSMRESVSSARVSLATCWRNILGRASR